MALLVILDHHCHCTTCIWASLGSFISLGNVTYLHICMIPRLLPSVIDCCVTQMNHYIQRYWRNSTRQLLLVQVWRAKTRNSQRIPGITMATCMLCYRSICEGSPLSRPAARGYTILTVPLRFQGDHLLAYLLPLFNFAVDC